MSMVTSMVKCLSDLATPEVLKKNQLRNTYSTHSGVDEKNQHPTTDVTVVIRLQSPAGAGQALRL
jgi:hypothetical protein